MPWWDERVRSSRGQPSVVVPPLEKAEASEDQTFDPQVVWSLLNPAIVKEAMPRFAAGHYADAVEASLKVVCREIRAKTG